MPLSNDERGWIMTGLSGIACVVGAAIICVDIIVRQFPGKKNFRIQDSDAFLSASLSLSFGVMLFSALYKMLPSAKTSLQDGGFSPRAAAWILIACFIGGVVGIQLVSRVLHRFIPSHVVDCEHSHEEGAAKEQSHDHEPSHHPHGEESPHTHSSRPRAPRQPSMLGRMHSPLVGKRASSRQGSYFESQSHAMPHTPATDDNRLTTTLSLSQPPTLTSRPSLHQRLTTTISSIASAKDPSCSCDGPCYGYSEPCGQECFKNISARGGFRAPGRALSSTSRPGVHKSLTARSTLAPSESTPLLQEIAEEGRPATSQARVSTDDRSDVHGALDVQNGPSDASSNTLEVDAHEDHALHKTRTNETTSSHNADRHHHHVPSNAFLSIGLQTSIAIALHKLPEGFITYATNHANPRLGFSVFLALFVHNITEGFAMALPLYLAINNRLKAMLISFVLGGLTQPLGAGVAALWFKLAGHGNWSPSEGVYGGMFAVTAGIMASVALQLFSESLDLTHSRALCMVGAFSGMAIMGMSSALTA